MFVNWEYVYLRVYLEKGLVGMHRWVQMEHCHPPLRTAASQEQGLGGGGQEQWLPSAAHTGSTWLARHGGCGVGGGENSYAASATTIHHPVQAPSLLWIWPPPPSHPPEMYPEGYTPLKHVKNPCCNTFLNMLHRS